MRESAKQRETELLQQVRSLEARKKYLGELKAWLARRKLTHLDLWAMSRELKPKRADSPVTSKKPLQPGSERMSAGEQFVAAMRKQGMVEISSVDARRLVGGMGYAPTSYSHVLQIAQRAGLLRRGDRIKDTANGYMYVLTGGPKTDGKKPKGGAGQPNPHALKAGVKRRGDPEFMRAIREARMDHKITCEDLGKKIGISGASIINWETGRYIPKEEARQKVLKALNLPAHLGAEATEKMYSEMGHGKKANGATTSG